MTSPEQTVLMLNVIVVLLGYLVIYPRVAGNNFNKITGHDLIATSIVLITSASMYYDSGIEFNLLVGTVNWFWFTLITYMAIEIPVLLWYIKKYKVTLPK
ncbi:hypothetical protein MHM98_18540 [Psychrobium sp. MM17-31]|uniref:hypothetical protein n=1 Tax=Psychrobium sp. MM17-31 TaxID=2917758 RepID=UPI001EF6069F|nr:hypothetical protein [Psychrobium sp. MM17-31]MCG7533330.1 hypothetical protein [Psychrobium sp. MM17-31]